jgi:acyl-CoA thioester hydrolase
VPILARATIDFRRPDTYPDTVTVGASVRRIGNTSFTMVYQATSRAQGAVVAEGEAVVVLLEAASGTKLAVPPALRAAIDALEASAA